MSGIALLLPKEWLAQLAMEKVAEEGLDVKEIKYIKTGNAVSEARRVVAEGCTVIIARGFQSSIIKQYTNVTVIEMTMTGQDLGILIKKAIGMVNVEHPVIGLVGVANMFANIDHFDELFGVEIRKYFGRNADELQMAADNAIADQVDIIIGGDTATMAAEQAGVPHLFLNPTFDSIREAIKTAETAIYAAQVEKRYTAQIGAFLDNTFNGIIRVNAASTIMSVNHLIEEIFNKKEDELIGESLSTVLKDIDEEEVSSVLNGKNEMYSSFIRIDGNAVVFILTAIKVENMIDGGIFSCQVVKKRENNIETNKMKEMYLHGYTARYTFAALKSKDKAMNECLELAKLFSLSSNPILIEGEIGSERMAVAEAIHNNSIRRNSPFISINCGDLSEEQQEKIIFGNKGAERQEKEVLGILYTANHGTVLLKEVEKLSKAIQYRIFCIIHKYVSGYGEEDTMELDVRIVATTNANLQELVEEDKFRLDLFYSLSGLKLRVPSLYERHQDLENMITRLFKSKLATYSRYHVLSSEAKEILMNYRWKGNKIQLESFMDRLVLSAKKRSIDGNYVKNLLLHTYPYNENVEGIQGGWNYPDPKVEKLIKMLELHHGDRTLVAQALGISKTTLWRHMKKYGIMESYDEKW